MFTTSSPSYLITLTILLCMARNQEASSIVLERFEQPSIDTLGCSLSDLKSSNPHETPWLAPPCVKFKYADLENNLPELLKTQAMNQWISVTYMTGKIKRFVLNCVYSLLVHGRSSNYIVAAFEDESLRECKALHLPCFNASSLTPERIANEEGTTHGSPLQWTKIHISLHLLSMGYNVHASDADVVYLRNTNKSFSRVLQQTNADAVFASEEVDPNFDPDGINSLIDGHKKNAYLNMVNSGVYAVRSNNRSIDLFRKWWMGRPGLDDQGWLNRNLGREWFLCTTAATCISYQRNGWFSALRHPPFWTADHCYRSAGTTFDDPMRACDTRRLYVHTLCGIGYQWKNETLSRWKLWLIGTDLKPLWIGADGNSTHPFLPCAEDTAWPNMKSMIHDGGS